MNMPNIKKLLVMVVGLIPLNLTTLNALSEVTKTEGGETYNVTGLECLNGGTITLDYNWMTLESYVETNSNTNRTTRHKYSGSAVDNTGNNSWSIHGGHSVTEHVDLADSGYISRIHHMMKDIIVADAGNTIGNLVFTWTLRGVYDYGIGDWITREVDRSVSCK